MAGLRTRGCQLASCSSRETCSARWRAWVPRLRCCRRAVGRAVPAANGCATRGKPSPQTMDLDAPAVALCAAAVAYVVSRTDFHDKTWLKGQERPVRLVSPGRRRGPRSSRPGRSAPSRWSSCRRVDDGTPADQPGAWPASPRAATRACSCWRSLVFGIQPLLQVVRFRWMLRLQGIPIELAGGRGHLLHGQLLQLRDPGHDRRRHRPRRLPDAPPHQPARGAGRDRPGPADRHGWPVRPGGAGRPGDADRTPAGSLRRPRKPRGLRRAWSAASR